MRVRQAVEQQIGRAERPVGRGADLAARGYLEEAAARRPSDRRRTPRPTRRDRSRARARGRAARSAWPPSGAAAARRFPCSTRTRSVRGATRPAPSAARLASGLGRARSSSAASNAPACKLACAAASARSARRSGSPVSATARCRNAAAAASPPRACARPAERSSSAATSSSGPGCRCGQMPGATVGVDLRSVASASARWTARRCSWSPSDTPPSAPADDGTSPARRSPATRRVSASAAGGPIPSRSAARHSSSGSPTGSAAATSSRRRASSESASSDGRSSPRSVPASACALDQAEAARQLRRRQPPRQLEQRQRVAACLGDDPVADPLIQLEPHRRAQQRAGIAIAHALHLQLGQVLKLLARLARGEHDRDRLRQQATRDERRASAPTPDPATARRRPHTAADAARPPPRTGSTPPTRRGTDPALRRRVSPNTISIASRCGAGSRSSRSSIGPHS